MDYLADIDELIIAPPYWLGTDTGYEFAAHDFVLDMKNDPNQAPGYTKLQDLVDRQLKWVFDGSTNGGTPRRARPRHGTQQLLTLTYTVPSTAHPVMSFLSYARVEAENAGYLGWLSYTEVLFYFPVLRYRSDTPGVAQALYYVALVYIDDSEFDTPERDPASVPILFGRELFGMPKAPGRIEYDPDFLDFGRPTLQIWDYDDPDLRLRPKDAIVFDPDSRGAVYATMQFLKKTTKPILRLRERLFRKPTRSSIDKPRPLNDLEFVARIWGLSGASVFREPTDNERQIYRDWWLSANSSDPDGAQRYEIKMADVDGNPTFFLPDLELAGTLVGLKQFADPIPGPLPAARPQACYQAIVETALQRDSKIPYDYPCNASPVIEFPPRGRLDIVGRFDLKTIPGYGRRVTTTTIRHREGQLRFADPELTTIWDLI